MLLKHCIDSYRCSFRTCVNFTPHFTDSQPNHFHSLHRAMTKGMVTNRLLYRSRCGYLVSQAKKGSPQSRVTKDY